MQTIAIRAHYLSESLDLDRVANQFGDIEIRRLRNRIIAPLGSDRYVALYNFGVAVFIGVEASEASGILKQISSALRNPVEKGWVDEYMIEIDPTLAEDEANFDRVRISALTADRIDVISRVFAQSVAITEFDIAVDRMIGQLKHVYAELRISGRLQTRPRDLLRAVGANEDIIRAIIADLALLNAPQVTLRDQAIERLWRDLREEFELVDRFERLEFKVGYLRGTTSQLLDVVQARRAELLEMAIVALFVIDLVILVAEFIW
ncbi:MAG: RMD1 family protein [Candidatus Uhrbacteria bacterium]